MNDGPPGGPATSELLDMAGDLFPHLEPAGPSDLRSIGRMLGRPARGRVLVAERCGRGLPAVILTAPAEPDGGAVPPLLWLCCPSASVKMGRLESEGAGTGFSLRLAGDPGAVSALAGQEEKFAECARSLAEAMGSPLAEVVCGRGVAGGAPGAVKCLHAHLAFRLAAGVGVVGDWCLEALGADPWECGERIPQACLH